MIRHAIVLTMMLVASVAAHALNIEVKTPGTLQAAVSNPATVTTLTLRGTVDASDFAFIADEMTALTTLDLSAASISAYDGEAIQGTRSFAANTLPQLLLAGTPISSISFPASMTAIGNFALAGTALTTITVPASVATVGEGAFAGCTKLTSATVAAATLGDGAFSGCTALASVGIPSGTAIPALCFSGDTRLAAVSGFDLATSVGNRAFENCAALRSLPFGKSLRSIGSHAFSACGIETADLSACSALTAVGQGAFASCSRLQSLALPAGCDVADALAMNSPALKSVTMPGGTVPAYAFAGDKTVDATAALADATEVGEYALQGASSVSSVVLPSTLEYLGDNAMEGMTGLTKIYAMDLQSVPELGENVWQGVDQPAVELYPSDDMAAAFMSAEQWKEFDVRSYTTTGEIERELNGKLRACFSEAMLLVDCPDTGITEITVADIDGHVLAVLRPDASGRAMLDTTQWTTRVYMLGTNTGASVKLARQY